ncbi:translocation/assembly module TamB domain-containing protein [Desulforhopalus singaporensis]|uniref:Autotransporter translocation and assembly factor TamB n=1 Tax=Desulforhopalus singaporensis TaxID=91360 RepID=A0A1H0J627_9BACT|nr:translocation/assembly module TamB domain-containing protein [Desulforhopalus singaporensis]SDO39157.1 Autotransporter translocation and assembly factor TamB [Desulforhopalus singaporensis]
MKKRYLLSGALVVLSAVLFFLLATTAGLQLLWKGAFLATGGRIVVGEISGTLLKNVVAKDLRFGAGNSLVEIDRVELTWQGAKILQKEIVINRLGVDRVRVTLQQPPAADSLVSGTSVAEKSADSVDLRSLYSMMPDILVDNLQLDDFRLVGNDNSELLVVDSLDFKGSLTNNRVGINRLRIAGPDLGFTAEGNMALDGDRSLDLTGQWRLAGFGFHPMTGRYSFSGPLLGLAVEVAMETPGDIKVAGVVKNLTGDPQWVATLDALGVDLSLWIKHCPPIFLRQVHGDLYGDFASYLGLVEADGDWAMYRDMHLTTELDGDGWGILFKRLRINHGGGSAVGDNSSISWEKLFSWRAGIVVDNFNPQVFANALFGSVGGRFNSIGDVTEDGLDASFDIEKLSGSLNGLEASLEGRLNLTEKGLFSDGLVVQSGDNNGVARLEHGEFIWDRKPSWKSAVRFDGFNPAVFHPEFGGRVDGRVMAQGYWNDRGLFGDLQVFDVKGVLRGQKLNGEGAVNISENSVATSGLTVGLGPSSLRLSGGVGDEKTLTFELLSTDLSTLVPDMRGKLSAKGAVAGVKDDTRLHLLLDAERFGYKDLQLGTLQGEIDAAPSKTGVIKGGISYQKLAFSGLKPFDGTVEFGGTRNDHSGTIAVTGNGFSAKGRFAGSYGQEGWQGRLSSMQAYSPVSGAVSQNDQAVLAVDRNRLSLEGLCAGARGATKDGHGRGPATEVSGCISGKLDYQDELSWDLNAHLDQSSLAWFASFFKRSMLGGGTVGGDLFFAGDGQAIKKGQADLQAQNVQLILDDVGHGAMDGLFLPSAGFSMTLKNKSFFGSGSVQEQDGGGLEFDLRVDNAGDFTFDPEQLPIAGKVTFSDFEAGMFGNLSLYAIQPSGSINSVLTIDGTLKVPRLTGKVDLLDGGLYLPYQGITLKDVSLELAATPTGARIGGTASSGGGLMDADGKIEYQKSGPTGTINLKSNDFLLVDLPEYSLTVDSDVVFTFNRERGTIAGVVTATEGLVAPEELQDSVSVSEDVVIVDAVDDAQSSSGWPLFLDLHVFLGDRIMIDGYGLRGRLTGDLLVETTPSNFIVGRGELDLVEGGYSIYGRAFDIERGRFVFSGGPIDNPGIDVRAQKKVGSETALSEGYTVGVDISGLVHNLQFRLFSDPYMEDTEILSYLIMGHSLAGSTQKDGSLLKAAASSLGLGEGSKLVEDLGKIFIDDVHFEGNAREENISVVLGKRITEDLYVGYDYNMFSELGQFRVRYDLVKGFRVETSSSIESTGADLLYSFER